MVDPVDAADDDDHLLLLLDPADIPAVDCLPEGFSAEGAEEEEEELEWLSNKDAFPALETSFEASAGGSVAIGAAAATPLLAPARPRSKRPRRRRRVFSAFAPETAAAAVGRRREVAERRRCRHCEAEETPQWRAGPEGPKTLCNACGVRYKSGRLVPEYRPAASPSFSPALHSNSHRRILEMRRRRAARPSHKAAPPPLPKL